jgi:hypothetical protein
MSDLLRHPGEICLPVFFLECHKEKDAGPDGRYRFSRNVHSRSGDPLDQNTHAASDLLLGVAGINLDSSSVNIQYRTPNDEFRTVVIHWIPFDRRSSFDIPCWIFDISLRISLVRD